MPLAVRLRRCVLDKSRSPGRTDRPSSSWHPLAELLLKPRTRRTVKKYLLEAGILVNVCELCGLSDWRGKPLTIQVDHRNGSGTIIDLKISNALPELSSSDGHIRGTQSQTVTRNGFLVFRDSETVSRLTLTQVFGVRIPVPERRPYRLEA
jgi:hypothetical protein